MEQILCANYNSPIGALSLLFDESAVIYSLLFGENRFDLPKSLIDKKIELIQSQLKPIIKNALDEYFNGSKNAFDNLQLIYEGTTFQKASWDELRKIPYGETISYQEQCNRVGSPKALRAVGQANNKNPIAIIIPCHRVIGKNGTMTGFGGGIDIKVKLLELEQKTNFHLF